MTRYGGCYLILLLAVAKCVLRLKELGHGRQRRRVPDHPKDVQPQSPPETLRTQTPGPKPESRNPKP